ncbi:MAG: hypothetical protein OXG83_10715 [Acidobacteria bacterium]|nr:hypothetical protein [Acidobacteriota bacterium]
MALAWACIVPADPPPLQDGELESVAVEPPRDSVFRPDEDQREVRGPVAELGGRLPGAFPEGFPLPDGSTVFDFGEVEQTGEGEEAPAVEFVNLRLPLGAPAAREWLLREAQSAGWRVALGDTMTFRRDNEWVRVAIEPGRTASSAAARFEYPKS